MSVLLPEHPRVAIVGITGSVGRLFCARMKASRTPLVAGINPKKPGTSVDGIPVFANAQEAVDAVGINAALVTTPAQSVLSVVADLAQSGVEFATVYTEGVPLLDTLRAAAISRRLAMTLLGPNSAGIAVPGLANLSDLGTGLLRAGNVAVVSRSGTLTYEVIEGLQQSGLGLRMVCCLGGDACVATSYQDVLRGLAEDDRTQAVVLVGEIGGTAEVTAAHEWGALQTGKPLIAYIAGVAAPVNKPMGHTGALQSNRDDGALAKRAMLTSANAIVASQVGEIPLLAVRALRDSKR